MSSPYLVTDYDGFKEKFPSLEPKTEPNFTCIWSVEKMDVLSEKDGFTDVIDVVHIEVKRSENSIPYKLPVQVGTEGMTVDNFTAFNELQESDVIAWVKSVLTELRQDFVWDIEWATKPEPEVVTTERTFG